MQSVIFHVDVDAFFASVEQLRNPRLRGRPVAVGAGVIASCSYEARARGLSNGMALHQALRLCPELIVVPGRHDIYRCFTAAIWDILRRYSPSIETHLDEAFCDFTGTDRLYPDFLDVGRRIREEVREEVGLAVSLGIAKNRMMSKLAAKSVKPDGLRMIRPGEEDAMLLPMSVRDLPGVGPKTAALFSDMNLRTVSDLRAVPRQTLEAILGKVGGAFYDRARGEDSRAVHENEIPKSVSRETTFHEATSDRGEIEGMLTYLIDRAMRAMRQLGLRTRNLRVKIRYSDWEQAEAAQTIPATSIDQEIQPIVKRLLMRLYVRRVSLRHVGIVLSKFEPEGGQLELFSNEKLRSFHAAVDAIRDKHGDGAIVAGKAIELLSRLPKDAYGYVLRTPSLTK